MDWDGAIERMLARLRLTAAGVAEGFPHWADAQSGQWTTTADGDWTGGFWLGECWLAAAFNGAADLRQQAEAGLERLRPRIEAQTVFKSFPFYYGAALGAILLESESARDVALASAKSLAGLFDRSLGLIPLGSQAEEGSRTGEAETSIDSLQASVFLLWAAKESDDRELREVAERHARRVIDLHLRRGGSFIQSSSLDPRTGRLAAHYTHKGYSDTSTWGRAQAWGMLFSTESYLRDQGQTAWLHAGMRAADWWLAHVPEDRVSYWDFDDAEIPNTERDTAATAIATAALLRLSVAAPEPQQQRYRQAAEATAQALVEHYLTPVGESDSRPAGMLTGGCFTKRSDARAQDASSNCELIFGDYYLFESLQILSGKLDPRLV